MDIVKEIMQSGKRGFAFGFLNLILGSVLGMFGGVAIGAISTANQLSVALSGLGLALIISIFISVVGTGYFVKIVYEKIK